MSLHLKSPNQLLNEAKLFHPSNGPNSRPALGEDAWLVQSKAHATPQMFTEAPPSEEATQPFTESFVGSGKTTHAGEEPALGDFSSQLLPKAQPSYKTIQPLTSPRPVPKKTIHAKEEPKPDLTTELFAPALPCAQPFNDSFILPEEERHSKKNTTPEVTTQPFTQLYVAAEETNLAREEPASKELTTQQLAEASSPEESGEESQPFSPPYILLVDSTDTPEAIESIKATIRNTKPSDKREKVKRTEITSVRSKLSKYGYRAETIESETRRDISAVLQHTHSRVPNARLIISHRSKEMSSSPAIIRPKQPLSGRDTFGVVQRTQDVDFTINLLGNDSSCALKCQIIYKPDSDNCVLTNHTGQDINLTSLNSTDSWRVPKDWYTIIMPGTWGLSLSNPRISELNDCIFIAEIMLLKKQFDIYIPKLDNHAPHKRAMNSTGDGTKSTKRQKLQNGKAENNISPPYSAATSGSIIPKRHHRYAAQILDLADGETAIISSLRPDGVRSAVTIVKSSYQLRRQNEIDETASSKVFTAWHSEFAKDLVVKIPRYQDPWRLMSHVKMWKREKTTLEKLNHPNVVTLMASDGRILGLYLEKLPQSLFCGIQSTFQPLDALKILYGVASALEYLATNQIVHNDVKPKNIAYCSDRGAVLFDFGAVTSPLFKGPATSGTSWYMPPEFIRTSSRGAPGDIWALGITMLYVTGKIKYPDILSNNWRIVDTLNKKTPAYRKALNWQQYISSQRAKLNQKDNVESLIYQMLHKEPTSRINAAALVAELKAYSSELIPSSKY